jgi:chemotaxis-related protein WspD
MKRHDPVEGGELMVDAGGNPQHLGTDAPVHDCWNTIGVEGNGTCRELVKYIHCRNCPVYSAAGLLLLDRPLPPEYRREWTEHFAREKKLGTPVRTSVLLFRIASEWLGLPTTSFQEIAERRVIHSLPHRRGRVVIGLANIRGELTICVSLARALGLETDTQFKKRANAVFDRLLVTHWSGGRLAFPVDEVHGIHHFQQQDLQEPPATVSHSALTCTQGVINWRERTVGILDADALFALLNRNLS